MNSGIASLLVGVLAIAAIHPRVAAASSDHALTCYPSYGYQEGDGWVIPIRIWVREPRELAEHLVAKMAASLGEVATASLDRFRARIRDFAADSESREPVSLRFAKDPDDDDERIQTLVGSAQKTDLNGLVAGFVKLSGAKARVLLDAQNSNDAWLRYDATSEGQVCTGRVRLIEPTGLSVISDIDDTIKVTEIPAGAKRVVANTFFKDFVPAPGMAAMYRQWNGASFHYVSGGPWQLYGPLSGFLFGAQAGFPEGSFHMKNARKNLFSGDGWHDLSALVTNENLTYELKVAQIAELMQRFPGRRFILVGDSGERDPEVYRAIAKSFPAQVQEILIRDVVNDREKNKDRLAGMTIIPAPTVTFGPLVP
jgi:hypothetical protein